MAHKRSIVTFLQDGVLYLPFWHIDGVPYLPFGSFPGLSKIENSIAGVKTPCIEMIFIPLERSPSVDVQNGLA
jgi:hypothetical protein